MYRAQNIEKFDFTILLSHIRSAGTSRNGLRLIEQEINRGCLELRNIIVRQPLDLQSGLCALEAFGQFRGNKSSGTHLTIGNHVVGKVAAGPQPHPHGRIVVDIALRVTGIIYRLEHLVRQGYELFSQVKTLLEAVVHWHVS